MFHIEFSQIILIFIISLLVLGPRRLPYFIKRVFIWMRIIRMYILKIKNEFIQETQLKELKKNLKNIEKMHTNILPKEIENSIRDFKKTLITIEKYIKKSVKNI